MGSSWSSYKSKRKEKKDCKRKLREQLKETVECIARLQEQIQLENELLDQYQSYHSDSSGPGAEAGQGDCELIEMGEEIQALERKLFLEEIALKVTEERCEFLESNYKLLRDNEANLQRQSSVCQSNLQALKLKHEAIQFARFKEANPLTQWVVCSLPNLYL